MSGKVELKCNHCGEITEWYRSMVNEVGIYEIDGKLYCHDCLKDLAHKGVDVN